MASLVNHYSFPLSFAVIGLALALFLLRDGVRLLDLLALAALLIGFLFSFRVFSAGESTMDRTQEVEAAIGVGQPVLLEIQSPYCLACAAAKPIVDRIEQDYEDLRVIRVNIQDPVGASLARRYGTRVTPTFLLFDQEGQEQLRAFGGIDPRAVAQLLAE